MKLSNQVQNPKAQSSVSTPNSATQKRASEGSPPASARGPANTAIPQRDVFETKGRDSRAAAKLLGGPRMATPSPMFAKEAEPVSGRSVEASPPPGGGPRRGPRASSEGSGGADGR